MMGFKQMLVVEHDPRPLGGGHIPPQQIGVVSAAHRALHLGRGRFGHACQQALIRRIGHLDPRLACGSTGLATDIKRHITVLGLMVAHALLSLLAGCNGYWLVMPLTP